VVGSVGVGAGVVVVRSPSVALFFFRLLFWATLFVLPAFTFAAVWALPAPAGTAVIVVHYVASTVGFFFLLFAPSYTRDRLFSVTAVPLSLRLLRYLFWSIILAIKFSLSVLKLFGSVWKSMEELELVMIGQETPSEVGGLWRDSMWASSFYVWALLWFTTAFLFCADTALWFQAGCTVLGACIALRQRGSKMWEFMVADDIQKIPKRFSDVVFKYSRSEFFPLIWDRITAHMHYEDKCDNDVKGAMSYGKHAPLGDSYDSLSFQRHPLQTLASEQPIPASERPSCFEEDFFTEMCFRNYCQLDAIHFRNADMKWRLLALARGLGLPIPRPYRVPYIPGITVLIAHYNETIIMSNSELFDKGSGNEARRSQVLASPSIRLWQPDRARHVRIRLHLPDVDAMGDTQCHERRVLAALQRSPHVDLPYAGDCVEDKDRRQQLSCGSARCGRGRRERRGMRRMK